MIEQTETVSPLEIRDGDIVFNCGYRTVASGVYHFDGVARYSLRSAPLAPLYGQPLPPGFDGMASGGNRLARVARVVR